MFRTAICPPSGETTVFMRHLLLWMQGEMHSTLHTRQLSTQNNKYQVSQKHSCFSWWWVHGLPKSVEIDKYTKNKLCTKLIYLQENKWVSVKYFCLCFYPTIFASLSTASSLSLYCSSFSCASLVSN